ncbi:MAG: phosphohydrolase [Thermoplasmata archaeon HGW-Thermoplasmata-1]|nr:MAG: phosphohydrolase [Thermoplasmata archaeon HGW-Thermoplasmata-1]
MNREEALSIIDGHIEKDYMKKHMVAVGAIMEGLAEALGKDDEENNDWMLAGLLHDIDFEEIGDDFARHGLRSAEMLEGVVPQEVIQAIKSHNSHSTGFEPCSDMDFALIASDALSGLLTATALIMPAKRLSDVSVESVGKKFCKKDFAKNVSRERLLYCEKLGIQKEDFFDIGLRAMLDVSAELGL